MKKSLIICGLILGSSLTSSKAIAATFSQIVVYGDSLSDLGRTSALTGGAAPAYSDIAGGRFSNGSLWVEYLADSLGLSTNPNTNFAFGGATSGVQNVVPFLDGVQAQVAKNYVDDPDALYIVWGGANDYLFFGDTANPVATTNNLKNEVSTLIGRGAKNILVPNLPNLGNLPGTRNLNSASSLNSLTQAHNTNLAKGLKNLRKTNPDVDLRLLNVDAFVGQVWANPNNFGLTNTTDGCWLITCSTPETYFFWDDIHPTTAAHKLIGDFAFDAVTKTKPVPEPTTLLGSLAAGSAIVAFKRKLSAKKPTKRS
jgi:thermolabile hemolysin